MVPTKMESEMRVSHWLSAAICAAALALAGNALAEEASGEAAPSAENGEKLFTDRNCATCHTGTVAPKPSDLAKYDREAFQEKVDNHAEVGAFDGLKKADLDDIHAYLQTQAEE